MPHREPWTPREKQIAFDLVTQGIPLAEIGYRLGRTANAVQKMLQKSGIVIKAKWTPEEDRLLLAGQRVPNRNLNSCRCRLRQINAKKPK